MASTEPSRPPPPSSTTRSRFGSPPSGARSPSSSCRRPRSNRLSSTTPPRNCSRGPAERSRSRRRGRSHPACGADKSLSRSETVPVAVLWHRALARTRLRAHAEFSFPLHSPEGSGPLSKRDCAACPPVFKFAHPSAQGAALSEVHVGPRCPAHLSCPRALRSQLPAISDSGTTLQEGRIAEGGAAVDGHE